MQSCRSTITAPREQRFTPRQIRLCQLPECHLEAQHAYRRMIYEDERASLAERLEFLLASRRFRLRNHLVSGRSTQGVVGRRVRDILRYPHGEKIEICMCPPRSEDYRSLYRAYLHDPDLQDAGRVCHRVYWDNHEFSIFGWQSVQAFNGQNRPAQTRKVAANQACSNTSPRG